MAESLIELREKVANTNEWEAVMLRAHSAITTAGDFTCPLDESMRGLSFGQWQHEIARRVVLAVLDEVIKV